MMSILRFYQCIVAVVTIIMMGHAYAGYQLAVLHTNDIHARVQEINKYNGICDESTSQEQKCFGGYARIKTKVDELRSKYPNTILVDGGDQYQGTLWFYLYGGQVMSHFMNQVKYDAMGLGNHEFDNGPEGLAPFLKNVTFPVLSSNIDASNYPDLSTIKKSTVLTRSGEKIGIIGYTTTETPFISEPGDVEFWSEIESIQHEADRLKCEGVNKIIAIGHAGYSKDQEIARKVTGVDVIVGGHSNTFLYTEISHCDAPRAHSSSSRATATNLQVKAAGDRIVFGMKFSLAMKGLSMKEPAFVLGQSPTSQTPSGGYPTVVTNPEGKKVLVVQDYAYGKYLGELLVTFDDNGDVESWRGNPILLDHTVKRDPIILDVVESYLPEIEKRRQENIGTSLVDLIGDRSQCRRYECNMGNLITDAMVRQNLRHSDGLEWSKVTIAVVNGGGIRADLRRGQISVADVLAVQPFGNTVDIVEITGQTILGMLEHCASNRQDVADGWGGFLQVSGLRVVYDQQQPAGRRVYSVDVLCTECLVPEYKPLEKMKRYLVLMQGYLIQGSKGYDVIKDNIIKKHTIGNLDADILMDYIKENTPITTGLDKRIQFLGDIKTRELCL